ncbi:acyl carrier protein phosphodiesterase [Arachidicoccus soli]|uniref:DUF479 domain-containing protein n=1 Tax=Arachidicoccus soli TaxID=2341117 RepID=A0A386HRP8_9BACT|nr:ACP phosphodiesterase [Arachidicoccus soli]AYD47934.1 DUF479 domain-containing protein [Arachidicoccus soli]
MNFLAHAYLSFNNDDILVGNMIGDFVKGKQKDNYPEGIKRGIMLHREIDTFTDAHPIVSEAKQVFKPLVGLYSGAFVDVAFDYFLANDIHEHSPGDWQLFSKNTYLSLAQNEQWFPEKFAQLFPYMRQYDWLYNYRFIAQIEKSFMSVLKRAKYLDNTINVAPLFEKNIPFLGKCYRGFFPELKEHVLQKLDALR